MSQYAVAQVVCFYQPDHSAAFVGFDRTINETVQALMAGRTKHFENQTALGSAQASRKLSLRIFGGSLALGVGVGGVTFLLGRRHFMVMAGIWSGVMGYGLLHLWRNDPRDDVSAGLQEENDMEARLPQHFVNGLRFFSDSLNETTIEGLRAKIHDKRLDPQMEAATQYILTQALLDLQSRVAAT